MSDPRRATVTGRYARYYMVLYPPGEDEPADFKLVVTYHRRVRGQLRQLTISDKLMGRLLRVHWSDRV